MLIQIKAEGQPIQYDEGCQTIATDAEETTWIERSYTKEESDLIANLLAFAVSKVPLSKIRLDFVRDVIGHHRNPKEFGV